MIKISNSEIEKCIIHKVANKYNSGQNAFSNELVKFDEESYELLLPFLLKPFYNSTQSYRFNTPGNLNKITNTIFEKEDSFIQNSISLVNHLYEQSNSAQIKTGDVLVVLFDNIEYKNILTNAIGIFKIESKVDFFQTYLENENFDVVVQKGISPKKLDKGCLILNTTDSEGRVVLSVDNNNYDTHYWIKDFLDVRYADNSNLHTQNYLEMCKNFSEDILKNESGKHQQNVFLTSTVDFFKENESFNISEFEEEVLKTEKEKEAFINYKKEYEDSNNVLIRNSFEVSEPVFKQEKKKFKTEIKLDTNIQIKLDVDCPDSITEYVELGYDEEKKMKYYKVYFNSEK